MLRQRHSSWRWIVCLLVLPLLRGSVADARILYVDAGATGANDGSSWADAYRELQSALATAQFGDAIWVAAGTYRPDYDLQSGTHACDRTASFRLLDGVAAYGGFPVGGGDWNSRDPEAYRSVLSGDLRGDDGPNFGNTGENSYHVVTVPNATSATVLDGFVIQSGNAELANGGGMLNAGSPTAVRCPFRRNSAMGGGGVVNEGGRPTFIRCTFSNNRATAVGPDSNGGGGMCNSGGNSRLVRCIFRGNQSGIAGGFYNFAGTSSLTNCVIYANAAYGGGGIANIFTGSELLLTNCTIFANSAQTAGGGVFSLLGTASLRNCILWSNTDPNGDGFAEGAQLTADPARITLSYSSLQRFTGRFPGLGNTGADPMLTPDGHLRAHSPCIDVGDPIFQPSGDDALDIDGEPRVLNGRVDMGADAFIDSDVDDLPDWWEERFFGSTGGTEPTADEDLDGATNLVEYTRYSSNPSASPIYVADDVGDNNYDGTAPAPSGASVGPKKTIQAGLNVACDGDSVLVMPGDYVGTGNVELNFDGKRVLLRAAEPAAPLRTTIDSGGTGRAVDALSLLGAFPALSGFAITGGVGRLWRSVPCRPIPARFGGLRVVGELSCGGWRRV